MDDLTVLFYTANLVKPSLMEAVTGQLREAVGNSPIISVSQKPMDLGRNICVGDLGQHVWNIYWQILVGARAARTRYVAAAEDDILYPYEHFHARLPGDGAFLYDTNRWLLFTWKPPMFSHKGRGITGMMLCERELLIEALKERFARYSTPESIDIRLFGEIGRNERELGVRVRRRETFSAPAPSVMFNHKDSISYATMGRMKSSGYDPTEWLPGWGAAEDVLGLYRREESDGL